MSMKHVDTKKATSVTPNTTLYQDVLCLFFSCHSSGCYFVCSSRKHWDQPQPAAILQVQKQPAAVSPPYFIFHPFSLASLIRFTAANSSFSFNIVCTNACIASIKCIDHQHWLNTLVTFGKFQFKGPLLWCFSSIYYRSQIYTKHVSEVIGSKHQTDHCSIP